MKEWMQGIIAILLVISVAWAAIEYQEYKDEKKQIQEENIFLLKTR